MIIGVPTETKTREYRVGINPGGVRALVNAGHKVLIQKGAGEGSGITDDAFEKAGATIVPGADDAWAAEMVMKVKEPASQKVMTKRKIPSAINVPGQVCSLAMPSTPAC